MRGHFRLWAAGAAALFALSAPLDRVAGPQAPFPTTAQAETARVPGDVCFYEVAPWSELTPVERTAWSSLGWTQENWDSDDVTQYPQSEFKEWVDLTEAERATLTTLGYTDKTWDNTEEYCPKKPS